MTLARIHVSWSKGAVKQSEGKRPRGQVVEVLVTAKKVDNYLQTLRNPRPSWGTKGLWWNDAQEVEQHRRSNREMRG